MQLQALRRDCANKAMRVKKLWLLSGEDVKRLGSVGLKLAGMQLALTFTFVVSFIPYVCIGSFRRLFIMQRSAPPHPQVLKESLSSLHPAPPKEEALKLLLLLPQPLATALPSVFCHACRSSRYSVARAAAGCLNQLYSQSQLSNFSQ